MTTLNARANQAYQALVDEAEDRDDWLEFGSTQGAFEEGWETGYKTAAEEILAALESLTPLWLANTPTTDDGLGQREVLRLVREIGGLS